MEITSWTLYWITRLDGICEFAMFASIMCGACLLTAGCFMGAAFGDNIEKLKAPSLAWARRFAVAFVVCILIRLFTPTTKELAAFIVLPKIANSELVTTDIPDEAKELYGLAKEYLKSQVEDKKK